MNLTVPMKYEGRCYLYIVRLRFLQTFSSLQKERRSACSLSLSAQENFRFIPLQPRRKAGHFFSVDGRGPRMRVKVGDSKVSDYASFVRLDCV